LIKSIRAERSPYHSWAGEAVDNSLDAQATRVALTMNPQRLDAQDNGIGITQDRAQAIVQVSQHGDMVGTKLGRFGVGIKYKAIQHGRKLYVSSKSKDGLMRRRVDWEKILRSGKWQFEKPVWTSSPGNESGTLISITDLITKPPKIGDLEKTRFEIQRRYYPALESGVVISLNKDAVSPLRAAPLTDAISVEQKFPGGRSVRVRAGMLTDHSSRLRQVDLVVAYRVIKPECAFGCDGYGGIRAMYARIDLLGPWHLTKFKDDIAEDPYENDLEAFVAQALHPILEKCQAQAMFARHRELENMINELLPEQNRMARPDQKRRLDRKGPKRGDKREKDLPENKSSLTSKKRPRGILIEFANDLNETYGFGRAEMGKSSVRIQLAIDNPHILELANGRDQRHASIGLYAIAMLIYEGELSVARLVDEPIGLRAWRVASQQKLPEAAE
jgi:hypothetical protein